MKKYKFYLLAVTLVIASFTLPAFALDQKAKTGFEEGLQESGGSGANKDALNKPIQDVIKILLYVAGVAAVIVIVIGGIRYITSDGDANQANQAKKVIIYAVIGLVVVVFSYAIVNFILEQVTPSP